MNPESISWALQPRLTRALHNERFGEPASTANWPSFNFVLDCTDRWTLSARCRDPRDTYNPFEGCSCTWTCIWSCMCKSVVGGRWQAYAYHPRATDHAETAPTTPVRGDARFASLRSGSPGDTFLRLSHTTTWFMHTCVHARTFT